MRLYVAVLMAMGLVTVTVSQAEAQEYCGLACLSCGPLNIGVEASGVGPPQEGLAWWGTWEECEFAAWCGLCGDGLVGDDPSAAEIVRELRSGDTKALSAVVERYQDRLFLDVQRGLLAIRGAPCDAEALASVAILDEAEATRLAQLGVEGIHNLVAVSREPGLFTSGQ